MCINDCVYTYVCVYMYAYIYIRVCADVFVSVSYFLVIADMFPPFLALIRDGRQVVSRQSSVVPQLINKQALFLVT